MINLKVASRFLITIFTLLLLSFQSCTQDYSKRNKNNKDYQAILANWIKLNAKYPKTYKPLSFKLIDRIFFGDMDENEYYTVIEHSYQLHNLENIDKKNTHYFVLSDDDKMSVISVKRPGTLFSIPPSTFKWTSEFSDTFINVYCPGKRNNFLLDAYNDWKFLKSLNLGQNIFNYTDSLIGKDEIIKEYKAKGYTITIPRIFYFSHKVKNNDDSIRYHNLGILNEPIIGNIYSTYFPVLHESKTGQLWYGVIPIMRNYNKGEFKVIGKMKTN